MTNNDELAIKLKAAADKSVDNFDPNMFILTRDMVALLAERDADKIQLDELESKLSQNESWSLAAQKYIAYLESQANQLVSEIDADKKRIAELEARTVSVKLPKKESEEAIAYGGSGAFRVGRVCGFNQAIDIMSERLTAAGIKLEVGE